MACDSVIRTPVSAAPWMISIGGAAEEAKVMGSAVAMSAGPQGAQPRKAATSGSPASCDNCRSPYQLTAPCTQASPPDGGANSFRPQVIATSAASCPPEELPHTTARAGSM